MRNVNVHRQTTTCRLGEGCKFRALERDLRKRGGIHDAGALAAFIGRRKYGNRRFAALAAHGRTHH
jgi:hypothetical protein